jgi:hypothetical protein
VDDRHRAQLLIYRANLASPGDQRAATWLTEAISIGSGDRVVVAAAHEAVRRHRAPDPAPWDTAWVAAATGQLLPQWISVDIELLDTARAWVQIPHLGPNGDFSALQAERDYLAAHPELLDDAADAAIEEALLPITEDEGDRYRAIRNAAQMANVEAAYQPLLVAALIQRFVVASDAEQCQMLNEHRSDLTSQTAAEQLAQTELPDEAAPRERKAHALLNLAALDDSDSILNDIFEALEQPQRFPAILRTIASGTHAATMLPLAAIIAQAACNIPEIIGFAYVYAAIAAAINDDTDSVAELSMRAVNTAPHQRDTWIIQVTEIAASTPAALVVIPALIRNQSE